MIQRMLAIIVVAWFLGTLTAVYAEEPTPKTHIEWYSVGDGSWKSSFVAGKYIWDVTVRVENESLNYNIQRLCPDLPQYRPGNGPYTNLGFVEKLDISLKPNGKLTALHVSCAGEQRSEITPEIMNLLIQPLPDEIKKQIEKLNAKRATLRA